MRNALAEPEPMKNSMNRASPYTISAARIRTGLGEGEGSAMQDGVHDASLGGDVLDARGHENQRNPRGNARHALPYRLTHCPPSGSRNQTCPHSPQQEQEAHEREGKLGDRREKRPSHEHEENQEEEDKKPADGLPQPRAPP